MASGSFEFNASGYLQGKIDWSSSSNGSSANSSNVTAILYARRTNSYTTKGQSWSGYVKIGSTQKNISFSSSVSVSSGWVEMARVSATVAHSNDGSGSAAISGSVTGPSGTALSGNTSSGSKTVTLDRIARYTSISSFTVSKRSENTFTFAWKTADTIDYVWYSTNNGSSWTGYDVSDGTSGSFTVSGLSANTTYNCKLRVRRKDSQLTTDSSSVSQTTYKAPTFSVASKTETTITINWSCDSTVDYIYYSTNSGSGWYGVDVSDGTSGSITISRTSEQTSQNLKANTSYGIRLRVRRKASQTTYDVGSGSVTTYDYPYCTESPNFTIGNRLTLKFYNPLGRTFTFYIISNGTQISNTWQISGTSYTGVDGSDTRNQLYATILNATSAKYQVKVVYGSSTKTRNNGNTVSIKTSDCYPTFSNFTYQDTNATTVALTGNNQILVNGYSNVKATISTSNKAVAKNSATMKTYKMTIGSKTTNPVNYSSSAAVDLTISGINNGTITVYATDSRGLSTSASKTATFKSYYNLQINSVTATRSDNGVGQAVTLAFNGYCWNGNFGAKTNSIQSIKYLYKETTASSSNWTIGETKLSVSTSGTSWSGSASIKGDLGADGFDSSKAYNIRLQVSDYLVSRTYDVTISAGTPAIAIYKNNVAIKQKYDTSKGGALQVNGTTYVMGDVNVTQNENISGDLKAYGDLTIFGQGNFGGNIQWYANSKNDVNYNDFKLSGTYYMGTGCTNGPESNSRYWRLWVSGNNGGDLLQIVTKIGDDSRTYVRTSANGTWGAWKKFVIYDDKSQIARNAISKTWWQGRDGAIIRQNTYNGNSPIMSIKTTNGSWELSAYSDDAVHLVYITDTDYTAQNNSPTVNLQVRKNSGVYNYLNSSRLYFGNVLYSNSSGTTGTVTLSESAANFQMLEIFYSKGDFCQSVRIVAPNGKKVSLIMGYRESTTLAQIQFPIVTISGTSITKTSNGLVNLSSTGNEILSNNEIRIYCVVGWR